jgi:hypothetical protein
MSEDFQPCVCHTGITWDIQDLDDDGYCPQYHWETEDREQEEC